MELLQDLGPPILLKRGMQLIPVDTFGYRFRVLFKDKNTEVEHSVPVRRCAPRCSYFIVDTVDGALFLHGHVGLRRVRRAIKPYNAFPHEG